MTNGFFSGVNVLELGHRVAGPYCGRLLALMGANVIKVERPDGGDSARRLGPFPGDVPHPEKSGLFLYLNTNKKGITLNLKTESGRGLLKRLVAEWADIVVENFEPRVLPSLGLGYEELSALNPRLVMTSISNFGQTGPYRDYEAEDINVQALGGIVKLTGDPAQVPLKLGGHFAEYTGAMYAAAGTAIARFHARRTGQGQQVDVSLLETLATGHGPALTTFGYMGAVPNRQGNSQEGWWPWAIFEASDGHVALGIRREWPQVVQLLPELPQLRDPDLHVQPKRWERRQELDDLVKPIFKQRPKRELYEKAQALGLPMGYSATAQDIYEDSHVRSRGYLHEVDFPDVGRLSVPGLPWQSSGGSVRAAPAPKLGEHNPEVFGEVLGYANEDLVLLTMQGAI